MTVPPIPAGYHTATPHLITRDAARAITFYRQAFGATERLRLVEPDRRIAHAELQFGDSPVMVSDEFPERGFLGPESLGGSPVAVHLYVEDAAATAARAVELGAALLIPVEDRFYGDRSGRVRDPFGHHWVLATHVEEVAPDEMERRFAAMFGSSPEAAPEAGRRR